MIGPRQCPGGTGDVAGLAAVPLPPGRRLVARTRPLTGAALRSFDPVSWAGDDGVLIRSPRLTLAGRGVTCRLVLPGGLADASGPSGPVDLLGSADVDDAVGMPGCGPVAFASLPFDPVAAAAFTVPSVVVGVREDGLSWITEVSDLPDPDPVSPRDLLARSRSPGAATGARPPDAFALLPSPSHADWLATVSEAVGVVRRGDLQKIVLARRVLVETNRPIVVRDVLRRLVALYPSCTTFSMDGFMGASPELLVHRYGRDTMSYPLAGTIPHSGDPVTDNAAAAALLSSPKELHEHGVAARAVAASLAPFCDDLSVPTSPSIVSLRNVSHLGTPIRGRLRSSGPLPTAVDLVAALHPTPAVAGEPRAGALAWIAKLETSPRGPYAGPVGWVDANGDGEFVVGIRSAAIRDRRAELFAGVGVVADSDPAEELVETQLKLQALLAALVRP